MGRDIDLYNVTEEPSSLREAILTLRRDYDAHNHDGTNSRSFQTLQAETVSAGAFLIRKTSYADTRSGFWAGIVNNVMKLNLGDATNFLKWTGTALQISGDISGGSLNINNNAIIDSNGNATFVGLTSLNMKAYTNFESAGRFVLTGDIAPVFNNTEGLRLAPGATATHYARCLWFLMNNYVFNNNPTFSFCLNAVSINIGTGDGAAFVGLGSATVSGLGYNFNTNHIGIYIRKSSGVCNIGSEQNDASSGANVGANFATMADGDAFEFIIKVTATSVKYYYRKNGGTLTLGDTQTTHIPTANENNIHFSSTNMGTSADFMIGIQSAAYEH